MIRRLFTAASAISLLLFVMLVALLTVGTIDRMDLAFARSGSRWYIGVWGRRLVVNRMFPYPHEGPVVREGPKNGLAARGSGFGAVLIDRECALGDFLIERVELINLGRGDPWGYALPRSPVTLAGVGVRTDRCAPLAAALPMTWIILWWLRRRSQCHRSEGLCNTCLYDLRASTGRCPECGSPIPATK